MKTYRINRSLLILFVIFFISLVNNEISFANNTIVVNNPIDVYSDAQNAANMTNSTKQYDPGNYYIFKEYNGMLNISKIEGQAGAWINPAQNILGSNSSDSDSSYQTTDGNLVYETLVLNGSVKGYFSISDAKNKINSNSILNSGKYYIFRKVDGVLNISRIQGKPGVWINFSENYGSIVEGTSNPTEIEETPTQPKNPSTPIDDSKNTTIPIETIPNNTASYRVFTNIPGYKNSDDALAKTTSTSIVEVGVYYVYKTNNNMLNISKIIGQPGAWINPSENISTGNTTIVNEREYIDKISTHAIEASKGKDIYTSVMMAQAILETGWGRSSLASEPFYNLFGVKGDYNGQSALSLTFEYDSNGLRYETLALFKKYPSEKESFEDYVRQITGNDDVTSWRYNFYKPVRVSQTTSYKDATAYLTGRYATAPDYAEKLNTLIEKYDLTRFDINVPK